MSQLYTIDAHSLSGGVVSLAQYQGKVLLIVNTASRCGFTPQYKALQALYERYQPQGLEILGFPCNQFGEQEPGSAEEIDEFCSRNYGVTFPLFSKVAVKGPDAHPLYQWLTAEAPGILGTKAIKWNFTKFLIRRDGRVHKRYAPSAKPEELVSAIEKLLG